MIPLVVLTLMVAHVLDAQNLGNLEGRVSDSRTLTAVPGATVTLLFDGAILTAGTTSDVGTYSFSDLNEGIYQVLVELQGYQPALQQDVRVVRDKTAVFDFELIELRISETVFVTAKARGDDPREPVTTFSYDREQLRRSPGTAGDALRALDSLPGVAATGEFTAFTVRGRGPRDNLILVDGIPFDKVIHFDQSIGEQDDAGGGGRFSIFAPNLIGEANFQPGGFSSAFGGKNGSLLRLEVAEGNRATPSVSGRVEITGWEINYDGPSYAFGNTSFLLSARNQQFERLFKLIGNDDIGAPSVTDVIFKSTSELSEKHRLEVLGIYAPEDFERTVENVLAGEEIENTLLSNSQQDSSLIGVNWRYLTGNSSFLTNTFFYRESDSQSTVGESFPDLAPEDDLTPETVPVREDILDVREGESEIGWRGDFNYALSDGDQLSVGARVTRVSLDYLSRLNGDWIRYVYGENDFRPDPEQKFITLQPEFFDSAFDSNALRTAAYGEYALELGDVTLTPGVRYDYDGFNNESLWSPRINANIAVDPETRLNFATGIFYQTPRYLELAADPANLNLESERSLQFSVGLNRFLTSDIRFSVEGYYQKLDNLIVRSDRTSAVATNDGDGYATGVDTLVAKTFQDKWYWQVNYSYSVSKQDDNLGKGLYDTDFNRPHLLNLFLSYEFNERWVLAGKWRFASGRPTDAFIVHDDVLPNSPLLRFSKEITRTNADRLRSFQTLNLRLDYRRRFGPLSLIAFVDFFNVYNYQNVSSLSWDERLGENRESGLSAFPTFGIKFEF